MIADGNGDGDRGGGDEHRWRMAAQRYFEPDHEGELTSAIVEAIASAAGCEPTALKSLTLYEIVDVTTIEKTFFDSNPRPTGERSSSRTPRTGSPLEAMAGFASTNRSRSTGHSPAAWRSTELSPARAPPIA